MEYWDINLTIESSDLKFKITDEEDLNVEFEGKDAEEILLASAAYLLENKILSPEYLEEILQTQED